MKPTDPNKSPSFAHYVFEFLEDPEPSPVADPKNFWRTARSCGPAEQPAAPEYFLFRPIHKSGKWKMLVGGFGKIRFESTAVARIENAGAALRFFEDSDPQTFNVFCGLLQQNLNYKHLMQRVVLVAYCLPQIRSLATDNLLTSHLEYHSPLDQRPSLDPKGLAALTEQLIFLGPVKRQPFDEARKLIEKGEIARGLDVLYNTVDDILYSGDYSHLNSAFTDTDVSSAPIDFLLGMLTASLPVKTRLSARPAFFRAVKQALCQRNDRDSLLAGLE